MAKAAEDSVWLNRIQIAIGVLTLLGLGFTVYYTRKTATASGQAADASLTSAKAAQKSADIAEVSFRRLERPYLFIDLTDTSGLGSPTQPFLIYTFVNHGKTPAVLREVFVRLCYGTDVPLRVYTPPIKCYELVSPGQASSQRHKADVGNAFMRKHFVSKGEAPVILHGLIMYEDPTGATHEDRFCIRSDDGGKTFHIIGGEEYNRRNTQYPAAETESG